MPHATRRHEQIVIALCSLSVYLLYPCNTQTSPRTCAPSSLPISALSPFPRHLGTLFSIRYSGSAGDGKLFILENESRRPWQAQAALPDGRWSRVQYAAHDDLIVLEASPGPAGSPLVCDLELVRVEPGDRLRGRFFAPEVFPLPGPGNNL